MLDIKIDSNNNKYVIDNNRITWDDIFGNRNTAEIVESIPSGYVIWNIGNNAPLDYLIFALPKKSEYDWQLLIDPDTLKAIKVKKPFNVYKVRNGASRGVTIEELEKNIVSKEEHFRTEAAKITLAFLKSVIESEV